MKNFSMPNEMRVASIWIVWAFVAIGVLGWALFIVLDAFGVKSDAAAWVQAVGSIMAILGAAAFPVFHSKKNAIEMQERTNAIIKTAADLISRELGLLIASMVGNIKQVEDLQDEIQSCLDNDPQLGLHHPSEHLCQVAKEDARLYLRHGHVAKWPGIDTLVTNIISSHMITNRQVLFLSDLMSAISAAKSACAMLPEWDLSNENSLPALHRLDFCRKRILAVIEYLNRKK
ncbi:hypothetical protein [Pseudomonas yamanorum]|uniref:Uncharacterized protein n=1 Tax=Pseudomonas yamanorum TaxID=515393 RepID=A0A7Y8ED31_9PSED|nr:hypothetical protein [Pseudomonas yamanorum]NWE12443.1 hypothetical protein [Pseudomonas yamanorum]